MNRKSALTESGQLFEQVLKLHQELSHAIKTQFDRSLPLADELLDRWERASLLGFGKGSSIYDSSYVFGKVVVGENTWIGPFTIIDGSGKLTIGNGCTISAGVQIYTHDNISKTLTEGQTAIEVEPVIIGNFTYISPNVVIPKGITIGDHCLIATGSFVNKSIPSFSIAAGIPAKVIGKIKIENGKMIKVYSN